MQKIRLFSIVLTGWIFTIAASPSGGEIMTADTFFTGQQLVAYKLAQDGDIGGLLKAAQAGVVLDRPGKDDLTMLGLAVVTADREAIITLIRAGADPNKVIPDAGTPAILAISKHFNPPRTEAVAALLDAGYDPNQLLSHGEPYLFYFVDYNHWSGLKLALNRGGNINARSKSGESLLTYLLEGGDYTQARELIEEGADVSARGHRGESALRAVESKIRKANPSAHEVWAKLIDMRELILSKLPNSADRHSAFTEIVEQKIRSNTSDAQ